MSIRCPLSLVGLPSSDRALLETLFSQSWRYGPGYDIVTEMNQAQLIIADADDPGVMSTLQAARVSVPVLLIGASDGGTGWTLLSRPIYLPAVIDAVNYLDPRLNPKAVPPTLPPSPLPAKRPPTEVNFPAPPPATTAPVSSAHAGPESVSDHEGDFAATMAFTPSMLPNFQDSGDGSGFKATQQLTRSLPTKTSSLPSWIPRPSWGSKPDTSAQDRSVLMWRDELVLPAKAPKTPVVPAVVVAPPPAPTAAPSRASSKPGSTDGILLVGSSRLAQGSLMQALLKLGYPVDCVADEEDALDRLRWNKHRFVFLDVASLGHEAFALCRLLRKRARELDLTLRFVVVANRDGVLQRLWARLAGCDDWMVTPLKKRVLKRYLHMYRSDPSAVLAPDSDQFRV